MRLEGDRPVTAAARHVESGAVAAGLRNGQSTRCHDTYAAITPIVCDPSSLADLAGVSLAARLRAKAGGRARDAEGGFLFTHRGYSGPAVLDLSRDPPERAAVLRASWSAHGPEFWTTELASSQARVTTILARALPARPAERLAGMAGIAPDRRASELRRTERHALIEKLTACALPWTGDEGYKKAEVTGGGVALDEVDAQTLESRRHPVLFPLCDAVSFAVPDSRRVRRGFTFDTTSASTDASKYSGCLRDQQVVTSSLRRLRPVPRERQTHRAPPLVVYS